MSNCQKCNKELYPNYYHNGHCNFCGREYHLTCMYDDDWGKLDTHYIENLDQTGYIKTGHICPECFRLGEKFDSELKKLTEQYEQNKKSIIEKWIEYCKVSLL